MTAPRFNDRIIKDGFPPRWYVQDRLDDGIALLCRETDIWPGNTCICVRPKALPTDNWLPTARRIAEGFDRADLAAVPAQVRVKPLVWSEVDGDERAEVFGLVYLLYDPSAWDETNGWYVLEETTNTAIEADGSLEAAKAAAQADYAARILAALEPQPDPRDEVIARLVEAANKMAEAVVVECDFEDDHSPDFGSRYLELRSAIAAAKAVQHG